MKKLLRPLSFSLMGVVILLLITGSVVEQICGTAVAVKYVYTAPWTIALWTLTVVCAVAYICTTRMLQTQVVTFCLHFSFVVILAGAMTTHLFGKQGEVHLRFDTPKAEQTGVCLPFDMRLLDFHIDYYPGTQAPMDFVSEVEVRDNDLKTVNGKVSMNNIFVHRHYRFYQAQYDTDMRGVTLRVSYDPWGIGLTYTGYIMLLLSMVGFFFQKRTHFRSIVKKAFTTVLLLLLPLAYTHADESQTPQRGRPMPRTISKQTADEFCNLYVYYNDRVCPMQTLAKDFTQKLYGKPSYKGLSAEEVLCGWLFYYDDWAKEPCIKIKGKEVQNILGIDGKYACLNDYVGKGKYKIDGALQQGNKNARAADEKFRLVSMVCTGTMMRIYPIEGTVVRWYSWSDMLPPDLQFEDWQFINRSMDYVFLCIARNAQGEARDALQKIRLWQQEKAGTDNLPSDTHFRAEQVYNNLNYTRPLAMATATIGIILFIVCCMLLSAGKSLNRWIYFTLTGLMVLLALFLTVALALRWTVSGHIPLSNGFETMQFLAWVAAIMTVILSIRGFSRKRSENPASHIQLYLPFGYLICGMTLMVSMMSQANPQITNLMPVLQSPLLTFHVAIIMIAYCLLAFIMLNGLTAIIITLAKRKDKQHGNPISERLQAISHVLLYPAVFCLTIGIFIGAIWANISWGRYWGWDPKEVWALITMLVYSILLHTSSIKFLQKPLAFHLYSVIAFLFVLFTYFGVNFLLGGMHSYA